MSIIANTHATVLDAMERDREAAKPRIEHCCPCEECSAWEARASFIVDKLDVYHGIAVRDWRPAVRAKDGLAKLEQLVENHNERVELSDLSWDEFCEHTANLSTEELLAQVAKLRSGR